MSENESATYAYQRGKEEERERILKDIEEVLRSYPGLRLAIYHSWLKNNNRMIFITYKPDPPEKDGNIH